MPHCSGSLVPTRVLDIGNEDSLTVRLIESRKQSLSGPYMTLSRCWGDAEVLKLTTATCADILTGTPISTLPILYQDAITACKQLEMRYL
jgi:hypothetical protein